MPAPILKTIGLGGGGAGHDYSSLSAWQGDGAGFTGVGGNFNLVSTDTINTTSLFFNGSGDGEFTDTGTALSLSGITTDSSHTVTLTTGTGQSFRDNANVRSNALNYTAANGVGIRSSGTNVILAQNDWFIFNNLQLQQTGTAWCLNIGATATQLVFNNCILSNIGTGASGDIVNWSSGGIVTFNNCLFVGGGGLRVMQVNSAGTVNFNGCTLVSASDGASSPAAFYNNGASTVNITNCAIFGFTNLIQTGAGTATFVYSHSMTDLAGTTGLTGSKTYSNQFQGITLAGGLDFRAKSGADLIGGGLGGTNTNDISGFTRSGSAPTIGAWEVAGGAVAALPPYIQNWF